jgi:hypothetical protein
MGRRRKVKVEAPVLVESGVVECPVVEVEEVVDVAVAKSVNGKSKKLNGNSSRGGLASSRGLSRSASRGAPPLETEEQVVFTVGSKRKFWHHRRSC